MSNNNLTKLDNTVGGILQNFEDPIKRQYIINVEFSRDYERTTKKEQLEKQLLIDLIFMCLDSQSTCCQIMSIEEKV